MPNRANGRIRILLVEDNAGDALLLREELRDVSPAGNGFELLHVQQLADAMDRLSREAVDVVLLDLSLPDSHGLATLSTTMAHAPQVPVVVLTGMNDEQQAMRAVEQGAQDYLVKGQTSGSALQRAIRYAIQRKSLQRQHEELIAQLQEALATVKKLSGLLPICAWCKSVRDDAGYWQAIEQYIDTHSEATFSHGICPSCAEKVYKDMEAGGSGVSS